MRAENFVKIISHESSGRLGTFSSFHLGSVMGCSPLVTQQVPRASGSQVAVAGWYTGVSILQGSPHLTEVR